MDRSEVVEDPGGVGEGKVGESEQGMRGGPRTSMPVGYAGVGVGERLDELFAGNYLMVVRILIRKSYA